MKNFNILYLITTAIFFNKITCQQENVNLVTYDLLGNYNNTVVISWTHRGSYTEFFATSRLTGANVDSSWLGIGLNSAGQMV